MDELIENNENLILHAQLSKSYYLNKIFSSNEIKDFESVRLGEISKLKSGGTPKSTNKDYYNGKIKFLSISDINGKYLYETSKTISEDAIKNSSSWVVPKGTLLYTMYASPAIPFIIKDDIAIPQSVIVISLNQDIDVDYIYYHLQYMYNSVMNMTMTGTQANISGEVVKNLELKIPSTNDQIKYSSLLSKMDEIIFVYTEELMQLKEKKKFYLNRIFS